MKAWQPIAIILGIFGVVLVFGFAQIPWDRPPLESEQEGFRGLGMVQIDNARRDLADPDVDKLPAEIPPASADGPRASELYQNVEVLKDLSGAEFLRLMTAITAWVSPEQGCNYCHEGANFASDDKYTKIVSRRMIEMTRDINENWKSHVADTGVTCYTCHRGRPVPMNIWFSEPGGDTIAGQNQPSDVAGLTSLPADPYTEFLARNDADSIRVVSTTALPEGNRASIKQTEYTYGLMMSISEALGVNCTYCHNSRSFMSWDQSSPRRTFAYQGIRLVRDLNMTYLEPLKSVFPENRLGPHGQVPQMACATCHQGAPKPLMGASLVKTYPSLQGGGAAAEPAMSEPEESMAPEEDAQPEENAAPEDDATQSEEDATPEDDATQPEDDATQPEDSAAPEDDTETPDNGAQPDNGATQDEDSAPADGTEP